MPPLYHKAFHHNAHEAEEDDYRPNRMSAQVVEPFV